jgi:hypothetical protein
MRYGYYILLRCGGYSTCSEPRLVVRQVSCKRLRSIW